MITARWNEPCTVGTMPQLRPLPGGEQWVNLVEWHFTSETGYECIVPAGFICDLDSVPRIPFIYSLFKGRTAAAPLAHDWEYSLAGLLGQKAADDLMHEIGAWEQAPARYLRPMHYALRLFGHRHYRKRRPAYLSIN